jgi:hypothetical protein
MAINANIARKLEERKVIKRVDITLLTMLKLCLHGLGEFPNMVICPNIARKLQ